MGSPEANPKTRVWGQVMYLGGKTCEGVRRRPKEGEAAQRGQVTKLGRPAGAKSAPEFSPWGRGSWATHTVSCRHCLRVAHRNSQLLLLPTCHGVASQLQWLQEALGKEPPSPAATSWPMPTGSRGPRAGAPAPYASLQRRGWGPVSSERLLPASATNPPPMRLCGQGTVMATLSASGSPTQVNNTRSCLPSIVTVPGRGRRELGKPQGLRGRGGEKRGSPRGWSPLLQA